MQDEGEVLKLVGSAAEVLQGCVWVFVWVCWSAAAAGVRRHASPLSAPARAVLPAPVSFGKQLLSSTRHSDTGPANNVPACCPLCPACVACRAGCCLLCWLLYCLPGLRAVVAG